MEKSKIPLRFIVLFATLYWCAAGMQAQDTYLDPSEGFKASEILPGYTTFSCFDLGDGILFAGDGDTIRGFDLSTGELLEKYGKPGTYASWPSFLTLSPGEKEIWAGFTISGNTDDRIYMIDRETGEWKLKARFPGNFDLEFLGDSILVSGLNSTDWEEPGGIFILDTTGNDNHRKILETGGSSAGFALDAGGALYYGTSFFSEPNGVYRWDDDTIRYLVTHPDAGFITLDEAVKLTGLPAGVYDCEMDGAGDLVFSINDYSGDKVLAIWNGTTGEGMNYDTLAVASGEMDWLTYIRSDGSVRSHDAGNVLYSLGMSRPIGAIHADYRPVVVREIPNFSAVEGSENKSLDLVSYFEDPDDETGVDLAVTVNSKPGVAEASVDGQLLVIDFAGTGQTNVTMTATSNGLSVSEDFVVGVRPEITGDYRVATLGDLPLDEESYWNGSDGSGGFISGPAYFYNDYNPDFMSWIGWAYSSMSDISTPGWSNQYSAITGEGVNPSGGSGYGVAYASPASSVVFADGSAHEVKGFYVTNSTYTALTMKQGDAFSKKFGGPDGNDRDLFRLTVEGFAESSPRGSVDFLLADYTYSWNEKDYIIETWQWVGLTSLGKIDSLAFTLSSTDVGDWGMNTPAYFNIDNLVVVPDEAPVVAAPLADVSGHPGDHLKMDLSGLFTDPDDDDAAIVKKVKSITGEAVVSASVRADSLHLDLLAEGSATIAIEGISNHKTVVDAMEVTVLPTGMDREKLLSLMVYPNPTEGTFRVSTGTGKAVELSVFDTGGRQILHRKDYDSGTEIDLSSEPAGIYIVKVTLDHSVVRETIMKR